MHIRVIDLIDNLNDFATVHLLENGKIVSSHDGKDSIDDIYNDRFIEAINYYTDTFYVVLKNDAEEV